MYTTAESKKRINHFYVREMDYYIVLTVLVLILFIFIVLWSIVGRNDNDETRLGLRGGSFEDGNLDDFKLADVYFRRSDQSTFVARIPGADYAIGDLTALYNAILKYVTEPNVARSINKVSLEMMKKWSPNTENKTKEEQEAENKKGIEVYPLQRYADNVNKIVDTINIKSGGIIKYFIRDHLKGHMGLFEWFIAACIFGFIGQETFKITFPGDNKTYANTLFKKCTYDFLKADQINKRISYCILYTDYVQLTIDRTSNQNVNIPRPKITSDEFRTRMTHYINWVQNEIGKEVDPPNINILTNLTEVTDKPTYNGYICMPDFEPIRTPIDEKFIGFIHKFISVLYRKNMFYPKYDLRFFGSIVNNEKNLIGTYICINRTCRPLDDTEYQRPIQMSEDAVNKISAMANHSLVDRNLLLSALSMLVMLKNAGVRELQNFDIQNTTTWNTDDILAIFNPIENNSVVIQKICELINEFLAMPNAAVNQNPPQRPVQNPPQRPVQPPVQNPPQRPAQRPAQRPVQPPVQRPAQNPPQRPPQPPVQAPINRPTNTPCDQVHPWK